MNTMKTFCCAVAMLSTLVVPAFAGPIEELKALAKDLRSMQGDFVQTSLDAPGKAGKTLSGRFSIAQGSKFRFDYDKPYKQVLVSDGAKFSTYDADLAQMTVRKLDDSLSTTPLAVFSGSANVETLFSLKTTASEDGMSWVAATPKQADASVTDLRFGLIGAELRALAWTDSFGKRTLMKFSNVKRNVGVDAAMFAFKPPAGTEIVGQ